MYQHPDAPQTVTQVFEHGFKLFRASINEVFGLAFIGAAVGQIPGMLGLTIAPGEALPEITGQMGFALAIAIMVGVVLYGAIVARIHAIATDAQLSVSKSLQTGLRKGPSIFLAGIIFFFAVGLGISALILPGIVIAVTFMFCFYAIIVKDMGPLQGLAYSQRLVWQQWWRSLGLVVIMLAGLLVLMSTVSVIAGVVVTPTASATDPDTLPWYVELLVVPLISAVLTPLLYAFSLAIFYDLELRNSNTAE
jgi:hypothetical protein